MIAKKMPSLDIVIVDFNAGPMIRECLISIEKYKPEQIEINRIVIVDNGSSPPTGEGIAGINLPLYIIRNEKNRGFAVACNQGAESSGADYLLFLNPDTTIVHNSINIPIDYLEMPDKSDVGICGIQLIDKEGKITRSCARFPTPLNILGNMLGLGRLWPLPFLQWRMEEWDHNYTRIVDQVIGAFFLTRRMLYLSLKGFDERYFMYFEEVDYSFRAKKLAINTCFIADAQAIHEGGGTSKRVLQQRLYYSLRSRILYAKKHFSRTGAQAVLAETLLIESSVRLLFSLTRRSPYTIKMIIKVFKKLWLDFIKLEAPVDTDYR